MKYSILITVAAVATIGFGVSRVMSSATARSGAPVQWSVSKGYTIQNKVVPGSMVASAESAGGGEIYVRCSKGFVSVSVMMPDAPKSEAGTETITYISSMDGGAETTRHGDMLSTSQLAIGGADFLRLASTASHLRIRFTPVMDDVLKTVDFDLRGMPAAIAEMEPTCGPILHR